MNKRLAMGSSSVEVGKYGRFVLPKKFRERYGVKEGSKIILTGLEDRIVLFPVKTYDKPTEALFGTIKPKEPLDEPKRAAREYLRSKLKEDLG